jgi:hypothetical protein
MTGKVGNLPLNRHLAATAVFGASGGNESNPTLAESWL